MIRSTRNGKLIPTREATPEEIQKLAIAKPRASTLQRFNYSTPMAAAIAPQPWPPVLLPLKLLAQPGDRGAGDIIARVIGPIGGDAFKKWYKKIFGKDCGCGARQDKLNARWPLEEGKK